MDIKTIRQQYPQYSDMSDVQLADALHAKHYADMPKDQFYGKIGLKTVPPALQTGGAIAANVAGAVPDLLALGAKGVAAVGDVATMPFGGSAPWEDGSFASKVPWAPASSALKDIGSKAADAAGFSTPELSGGYQAAEIIGSVLAGGGVSRAISAIPKAAGAVESGINAASKAPVVGNTVGKVSRWFNPVPAYATASERAAASTSKLGAAAENIAPHVRDLGVGVGIVGGQQVGDALDSPEVGLLSSIIGGAGGGFAAGQAMNRVASSVPGSLASQTAKDVPAGLSGSRIDDVNTASAMLRTGARLGGDEPSDIATRIKDTAEAQKAAGLPVLNNSFDMADNPGVQQIGNRLRTDPRFGPQYTQTERDINTNANKTITEGLAPDVAIDPSETKRFVENTTNAQRATAQRNVADTESQLVAAQRDLDATQKDMFNQAFDDKGLRATTLKQQAATGLEAQIDAFNQSNRANYAAAAEVGGPEAKSLIDQRSEISKAIGAARANGDIPTIRSLLAEAENVDAQIQSMKEVNPEFAAAIDAAEASFKQGAPTFRAAEGRTTPAGQLNEQKLANSAPAKSEVLDTFTANREGVDNLRAVLQKDPTSLKAAGDAVVADLIPTIGADGKLTPSAMRAYMTRNADVLAQFPEQKAQLEGMLRDITNKTDNAKALEGRVAEAKKAAAMTEEQINSSAARFFLNKDPELAAKSILSSDNIVKDMDEVLALVRQDTTGNAERGLKKAVMDEIYKRSTRPGKTGTTDGTRTPTEFTFSRLDGRQKNALAKLYGEDKIKAIETVAEQLSIAQRKTMRAGSGSDTIEKGNNSLVQAVTESPAAALAVRLGVGNTLEGAAIWNNIKLAVASMVDRTGMDAERAVREVLYKAERDPDIAYVLLNRPVDVQSQRAWNEGINRMMNISEYARDKEQQNELRITVRPSDKQK